MNDHDVEITRGDCSLMDGLRVFFFITGTFYKTAITHVISNKRDECYCTCPSKQVEMLTYENYVSTKLHRSTINGIKLGASIRQ